MNLLLQRAAAAGKSRPGDLFIGADRYCFTLENEAKKIPAGRYPIVLTVSGRAERCELWTPDLACRLPLLMNVPGRSSIRMHAANEYAQLEGCIATGRTWSGDWLGVSRRTFAPLMAQLTAAADAKEPIWIDVRDPQGVVAA